jgi:copper transport protein
VERGLLLIGLCVALGGISGRGLAKNYKGDHPVPLPEPWVLPGSLLGMAGAAALIVTALADPHLAAALAHPLVPGPRAAATLAIAIVEFACFGLTALLVRVGKPGASVQLLLVVVLAESVRAHPDGLLPIAGALLTICHLLPAVMWVGMLAYTLQAAVAWRGDPAAMRSLIRLYANAAAWLFAIVVITGIASAALLVPLGSFFTTDYGWFLIAKSALVAGVAGLAIAGRRALNRATGLDAVAAGGSAEPAQLAEGSADLAEGSAASPAGTAGSAGRAGSAAGEAAAGEAAAGEAAVPTGPARVTKVELAMLAVVLILTGMLTVITPPAKSVFGGPPAASAHAATRPGGSRGHQADVGAARHNDDS